MTTGGAAPAPSTTSPRSSTVPNPTLTSLAVTSRPSRAESFGNTRARTTYSPASGTPAKIAVATSGNQTSGRRSIGRSL